MKIRCVHGYFMIREDFAGELARFARLYDLEFVPKDDYYTFKDLEEAPDYSLEGQPYLGSPAPKTFAGRPWEVMRENGLVYDFTTGLVDQIDTVSERADLSETEFYYTSDGLLLPGSLAADGTRVTDFTAEYVWQSSNFRYTEVIYD